MKRNMDLIREIMLALESTKGQPDLSTLAGQHGEAVVTYHAKLIYQAGLAEGICDEQGLDGDDFVILTSLRWTGHDFIEAARNDTLWNEAKAKTKEVVGGLVTDTLKMAMSFYANEAMSGALGIGS